MAVYDRPDVAMGLVDSAMDEALDIERATPQLERVAVKVELQNVVCSDETRRHAAREQKEFRVSRVPYADMSETVDHAPIGEDAVGGDEIVDEIGMRRRPCSRGRCFGHFQR